MKNNINVLQIATLNRPISNDLGYGPIETVSYNIDKGLHNIGYRSIVACSGDSRIEGEQFTTVEKSFSEYWYKNTRETREGMVKHLTMSLQRAKKDDIDLIHLHDPFMVQFIFKGLVKTPVPIVMTLHIPAEVKGQFKKWNQSLPSPSLVYFVPISEFQKKQHRDLFHLQKVIHHGIDMGDYSFNSDFNKLEYLFSIGRITSDKGQDKAIEVAKKTKSRLILAGNVQNKKKDRVFFKRIKQSIDQIIDPINPSLDKNYYEEVMKPILESDKQIIYIGELNSFQKKQWYKHAKATLFPIQWGEPFGLVLIESMACGTPVVAFRKGSVPEIIIDGKTGYIVDSVDEMADAVKKIAYIKRSDCRLHVEKNFSIPSMVEKYSVLYKNVINQRKQYA